MRRNRRAGVILCNPGGNSPPRLRPKKKYHGVLSSVGCVVCSSVDVLFCVVYGTAVGSVRPHGLFPTGFFFDWIILGLLIFRQSSRFSIFVLFLETVGLSEFCCMAVESPLEALCFVRSPRATRF